MFRLALPQKLYADTGGIKRHEVMNALFSTADNYYHRRSVSSRFMTLPPEKTIKLYRVKASCSSWTGCITRIAGSRWFEMVRLHPGQQVVNT